MMRPATNILPYAEIVRNGRTEAVNRRYVIDKEV